MICGCYIRVPKVSGLGLGNTQKSNSHPALFAEPLLTGLVINTECLRNLEGAVAAGEGVVRTASDETERVVSKGLRRRLSGACCYIQQPKLDRKW